MGYTKLAKRSTVPKDLQAVEGIKNLMFSRRLIPGQKLIYRDLEEALGMSKTPIINALVRLAQEGLVISKQNRGYFVKELTEDEIRQMYQMRIKLEEISIDLAIENYKEEDLIEWRECLDRYKSYQNGTYDSTRFRLDVDIHAQVAKMGKNVFLTDMVSQFFTSSWALLQTFFLARLIDQFADDHELLFEAIKSRKRAEAKKIVKRHHTAAMEMALQAVRD
jgi:DNA-binding GntR family transcriptional regulator